mmetsp:Transcript_11182/g.16418  ORF Transcript_11182/g.16418 Transcript_11182/m.16418 type:complete len:791 (-) Transcript_11182:107-2479(-)
MQLQMTKLAIVALLGALAVFLGTLVLTLQVLVVRRKQQITRWEKNGGSKLVDPSTEGASILSRTVTPSEPTEDIFLWKHTTPHSTSKIHSSISYWKQVERYLGGMGDTFGKMGYDGSSSASSNTNPPIRNVHESLIEAARLGHSMAQHYVATALSSGIWLSGEQQENDLIPEDFLYLSPQTMMLWHMAALDGNVEAAISLGHRIRAMDSECSEYMPYYETAANAIVDQLEAEKHSRAKVNPPMDKHSLPQVHIHGGTSSQLTWDNKPDESPEALQYYHLLSTKPDPDVHATYTLAHLYHYGLRGVPQNLTKALYYYEIAAKNNNLEAAGQAGKFHFWSLGFEPSERSMHKAHTYLKQGAPLGLEKCRDRYRQALKVKTKGQSIEDTSVDVCDHPSLNGMGLLYLYGVPTIYPVDIEKAMGYFQLAREMGNMDASYNLAMLRLGFRSSWKEIEDSAGESVSESIPLFMQKAQNFPSRDDWIFALRELDSAANKGHLQARHRLAMMYAEGVRIEGSVFVNRDCKKAYQHYRWIVDNASPQLSERTRTAYKQYSSGDFEGALVNYLMAAETGHKTSQVNAAFLLDRGVCLHLSEQQCRNASLRLWKAAAQAGDAEAALRVGDFYFFGSNRKTTWLDVTLFPEVHLLPAILRLFKFIKGFVMHQLGMDVDAEPNSEACVEAEDKVCLNQDIVVAEKSDADLEKAAQYYRLASQEHKSPRANFNLGYMHQWGLGLSQDFPLAKRHYDLAGSAKQASFASQLALVAMNLHEQFLVSLSFLKEWILKNIHLLSSDAH